MDPQKSIALLNQAVADELQAVHQYMYWHFHLDDQGFGPLAALLKRISIVEMT
ncbi:MAG TPA: ferritin-like domain-containing protein, partial [Phycisphaerae bacterium]|nr:ferritin-like domain-containing protein [Phycisphaerae bacterium]